MTLGTRLLTWFRGESVGTDSFGNRYYRERGSRKLRRGGGRFSREKRGVMYNGEPKGAKGPSERPALLPHTVHGVPPPDPPRYPREKPHPPNMPHTPPPPLPPGSL